MSSPCLRPPNPPAVLKPSMSAIKRKIKEASCHHRVCNEGKLCKTFLQMGSRASPSPRCVKNIITRFAEREGCVAYVVRA